MNPVSVYENMPVGLCVLKRDRKDMEILYANPAGQMLADAIEDGACADLLHRLKSTTPPRETTLKLDHGELTRWIKLTISDDDFGEDPVFMLWATDISASKEAEKRLEQAVAEADAAAEVKSNFLATMSHEIRTPMQSVYGLLELIGEERPPANIMSMLTTAKTSASVLLEILDDILDLAKIDADKMELDVFEVPVRTLVRGVIEAVAVKVHGKKVVLLDNIEEDVPFVIIGDPKRLRQILMNLIGNAVKFTHEGTVSVSVSQKVTVIDPPKHGFGLRFEITDTGMGMSKEAASRLFVPFNQADNSTARKFGGTGLGLSICKKLVELMGGRIGVFSEPGKGSTFWFEIPTEEVGTAQSTLELPSLEGISVLSVEDHPQGAKEIVRSLESMGAKVDSVPTFKEGLELTRRKPFDVGVIDQGLPDGLGLDLIREIMKIRPFMGLIMYTVRDDVGLAHSLQSLGVTYLTKPASRAGLGEAVQAAAQAVVKMDIDGPRKLLIAEDTESVRFVLQQQLEKLGVDADFVEDGAQALKAIDSGEYGILFTDLHMPEVDGYEVVKKIRHDERATARHFPVVVLTADVQMSQRSTYMTHGFDECLLKPVTLGQFRRVLIRWGLLGEEAGEDIDPDSIPNSIPLKNGIQKSDKQSGSRIKSGTQDHSDDKPPAIDTAMIEEQMGAFDEGTIEMLGFFVEMTGPQLDALQHAFDNDDLAEVKEIAHSLKGASRSACANVLGDIAADLQDTAEAGGACAELIKDAKAEFERVKEEVGNLGISESRKS